MKSNHAHHTKKGSPKHHASKPKIRKIAEEIKTTVRTRTHQAKALEEVERLQVASLKLPNKKFSSKEEFLGIIKEAGNQIAKKEIKLILEKMHSLSDEKLQDCSKKNMTAAEVAKNIVFERKF